MQRKKNRFADRPDDSKKKNRFADGPDDSKKKNRFSDGLDDRLENDYAIAAALAQQFQEEVQEDEKLLLLSSSHGKRRLPHSQILQNFSYHDKDQAKNMYDYEMNGTLLGQRRHAATHISERDMCMSKKLFKQFYDVSQSKTHKDMYLHYGQVYEQRVQSQIIHDILPSHVKKTMTMAFICLCKIMKRKKQLSSRIARDILTHPVPRPEKFTLAVSDERNWNLTKLVVVHPWRDAWYKNNDIQEFLKVCSKKFAGTRVWKSAYYYLGKNKTKENRKEICSISDLLDEGVHRIILSRNKFTV